MGSADSSRFIGSILISFCLLAILVLPVASAADQQSTLTDQERGWIAAHPVLRVGVHDNLIPIEYLSENQLRGIVAKYLQVIEQQTGLHFEFVAVNTRSARTAMLINGEVDILPIRRLPEDGAGDSGLLHTRPYGTRSTILISRLGGMPVTELGQMAGRTLVMLRRETYADFLREQAPGVKIFAEENALDILEMVQDGQADAAVVSEGMVAPYLSRQFHAGLRITGLVPQLRDGVSMAVREDQVILLSILDKVLGSISAEKRKTIYDDWLAEMHLDAPPLMEVVDYYDEELAMLLVAVLLLLVLVWQSRRQRSQALQREQAKAMFLAVMSHEIRSPMNSVLAAVELLGHSPLDEQQRHLNDLANASAKTLLRLVDDVLEISRIDADQLKLHLEPVDLCRLVQKELDTHRPHADEKGLELVLSGESEMALLLLDSARLSQVLHNLISNAIKFTEVGRVEVRLQLQKGPAANIRQLTILVMDSGAGLSPHALKSLFRPYTPTRNPSQRGGGTGLGLMICKRLVSLMNGKLKFASVQGEGTTVECVLPVEIAPVQDPLSDNGVIELGVTAPATPSFPQVLVVEASITDRQRLVAQLQALGCEAITASDSIQGVALYGQQRFDLVLVDCDALDLDGLALDIRELEQNLHRAYCPIIALSTLKGSEHLERYFDAGMDGVLGKPTRSTKLQELIELWCDVSDTRPQYSFTPVRRELSAAQIELRMDLSQLLEAVATDDAQGALQAAHRLYGAALTLEWEVMAASVARLEQELKGEWRNAQTTALLRTLVEQWHECTNTAMRSSPGA